MKLQKKLFRISTDVFALITLYRLASLTTKRYSEQMKPVENFLIRARKLLIEFCYIHTYIHTYITFPGSNVEIQ
jgi:hypothetical protein